MMKRQSCLAIIPAREGSKGIKNKNIKHLNGKPLIYYSIREAKKSKFIDKCIVSTDSKKIKKVALGFGAEVPFLRPKRISTDKTSMYSVVEHAVEFIKKQNQSFDIIVILQPTSPLRKAEDIDKAIKKLITSKADSVVSVCVAEHSPYWMRIVQGGKVFPLIKSKEFLRRQDLPEVYRINGAIYATKKEVLFNQKRILGKNILAFIMPQDQSADIDTELDFKLTEIILKIKR